MRRGTSACSVAAADLGVQVLRRFARMFLSVIAHRALFATSEFPVACALSQDIRMVPADVMRPSLLAMFLSRPLFLPMAAFIHRRCVDGIGFLTAQILLVTTF